MRSSQGAPRGPVATGSVEAKIPTPRVQWPSENFIRVAEALLKRGRRIVLVGARSEAGITSEIASSASGCLDLGGRTTLPELMSVLANVDAAVANDSGAMHPAAALG